MKQKYTEQLKDIVHNFISHKIYLTAIINMT